MVESEQLKRYDYILFKLKKIKQHLEKYEIAQKENNSDMEYVYLKSIERDCEECVECATRINQHILEKHSLFADSYRETFEKLEKVGIKLNSREIEELSATTGFRNRLAHVYMELDPNITIKSAQKIVSLYPRYLLAVKEHL